MTSLRQIIASASCSVSGLDAAKLEMAKYRSSGSFAGRECYLEEATKYLNNVIDSGKPAEQREAITLKAKVNIDRAKFLLGNYKNQKNPFKQEVSLVNACRFLDYAFRNGERNDHNESVILQTQVNIERAQLEWLNYKSKTTRQAQELCMQNASDYLNYIMVHGNAETRKKAVELNANISLEKAKLKWLDYQTLSSYGYQTQSSLASRKNFLAEATNHLRATIAIGKDEDKKEASNMLKFIMHMRYATKNETIF